MPDLVAWVFPSLVVLGLLAALGAIGWLALRRRSRAAGSAFSSSRRQALAGLVGLPIVGTLLLTVLRRRGYASFEEKNLRQTRGHKPDATTRPSKKFHWSRLKQLNREMEMPTGKIGNVEVSRLILGGNLIGGWAHARDLIYVSQLVKAYHTQEKIFETFRLAEACGVNTILTNPILCDVIGAYWKHGRGKIQFISDCGGRDVLKMIQQSIDGGACACYVQGGIADRLVAQGDFDTIEKCLELIRKNKLPAGIGGHKLSTIKACVDKGFHPDFWMKTLHHTKYWSAQPDDPPHDNIWCEKPEDTVAYMKDRKEPWIAFKTLAAGAIHPKVGFKHAFESGADFACVGMYDFQMVDDVNIALDVLGRVAKGKIQRQRPWCA